MLSLIDYDFQIMFQFITTCNTMSANKKVKYRNIFNQSLNADKQYNLHLTIASMLYKLM